MGDLSLFENQNWYTIEQLSDLCGLQVGSCKNILTHIWKSFQNDFQNTRIKNIGGHKNIKLYSENVLKALKEYQIKNSVPNAQINKETVVQGNATFIANQTISAILSNPKALTEFALAASQRLLEAQPKVEWYDNVADSTNLTEIGTVGKMCGIGDKKMFSVLSDNKIIYKKCDSDGVLYYVPYYEYEKYFKSIPEPFLRGDKKLVRNKLMFNQNGVVWATKRFKKGA